MEFIESKQLLHCTGVIVPIEKAFKGKKIILLYFADSTSLSCKKFLPNMKELYSKSKEMHLKLEIIYVSFDADEEVMTTHFVQRHGGWYAVPFGDPAKWVLRAMYGIEHIPSIVVLRPDGETISSYGMGDYNKLGIDVLVAWSTSPPR